MEDGREVGRQEAGKEWKEEEITEEEEGRKSKTV